MANRFVLNGISYHGKGAIQEIPGLVKAKGFKKAFIASDPDLADYMITIGGGSSMDTGKAIGIIINNPEFADVQKKRKFVCVDINDIPDIAIVDPDMMSTMPKGLTASTGMDALTHAIEGYTTAAAWELADCLNNVGLGIAHSMAHTLGAVYDTPPFFTVG